MLKNFKFDYDHENDSLFLYNPKSKSKASVEFDDFIVDFSSKKDISALEILNTSKYISDMLSGTTITKKLLKDITKTQVDIITKDNFFVIKFKIFFKSQECILTPILVPNLSRSSPALA